MMQSSVCLCVCANVPYQILFRRILFDRRRRRRRRRLLLIIISPMWCWRIGRCVRSAALFVRSVFLSFFRFFRFGWWRRRMIQLCCSSSSSSSIRTAYWIWQHFRYDDVPVQGALQYRFPFLSFQQRQQQQRTSFYTRSKNAVAVPSCHRHPLPPIRKIAIFLCLLCVGTSFFGGWIRSLEGAKSVRAVFCTVREIPPSDRVMDETSDLSTTIE